MLRRSSTEHRRRSSTLAPKRVTESAVKSAVKGPAGRAASAAGPSGAGSGSAVKSRLPRPSLALQRGAMSATKRGRHSAVAPTRSRLTVGPRLSAVTPQTGQRPRGAASTSHKGPAASRLSTDSQRRLSRGSGIGTGRGRCPDPRNINDKAFWQAATHRVADFLAARGFNEGRQPLTYKELIKCTGRMFDDVFSFMYGFFSPKFSLEQKKREEEVPVLVKRLGYPGLIAKSHLVTIGCAHSWPPVIAMLDWLATQVELVFGSDLFTAILPTVDNNGFPEPCEEERVLIEHSLETYGRWIAGQDQGASVEAEALSDALDATQAIDERHLHQLEMENQRLRQETPDLRRLESQLTELQQRRATYETDARRLAEYVAARRDQQTERSRTLDQLLLQKQQRATVAKMVSDQIEALKLDLSSQEMSAEDVARIDRQRADIQRQVDGVREEIAEISERNGAVEMELTRGQARLETTARRLNRELAELSARLPAAAAADGLHLRLHGAEEEQLAQLAEAEARVEAAERAARQQLERDTTLLIQLQRASRELRGQADKERQTLFHMQSRLKRLEEEEAADRRQLQQRHRHLDTELEQVESEISKATQEIERVDVAGQRAEYDAAVRQVAETKTQYETQLGQRAREVAENAGLALEFRRMMDADTDQMTREMARMAGEAGERMRLTVRRALTGQEQPAPLAEKNPPAGPAAMQGKEGAADGEENQQPAAQSAAE